MAVSLEVIATPEWQREEARIERIAGLDEFATDAEAAYELLAELTTARLPRNVIDFRFRKALRLIARAGIRARLAEAELRDLSPDGAA